MRIPAVALAVLALGCGPPPPVLARTAPPAGTPPVIAELRARFHPHWEELLADPSAAAARTRASAVAQAIAGDAELYERLVERDSIERVVARAVADAERASLAFPDAIDVWTTLARLRARAGEARAAAVASCRAADVDPKSEAMALACLEALLAAGDRAGATSRAKRTLGALAPAGRERLRRSMKARDVAVSDAIACEPVDATLGYDELIDCGDAHARTGDRVSARARYRAAFMIAPDRSSQFAALLRIEEIGFDPAEELMMLPRDRAAQFPIWRSMTGVPRRRLDRDLRR